MTSTRPLHLTPFRRLLSGYAVNSIGTWVGEISLAVLVLRETGSAAAVAAVFVAAHLAPAILAAPALLRLERLATGRALAVLLGLQTCLFASLAALAGTAPFEVVLVISALDGVAAVAGRALVKAAIVATTRPAGLLREGNALFSSVFTLCAALGPLLAGIVVAALGPRVGLALDAASFALAATLFAAGDRLPSVSRDVPRIGRGIRAGLEHIRGNRPLRGLVTFNLAVTVLAAIIVPVELVFVTETLGADEAAYGAVVTAWGVGMIAGGALVVILRRIPLRVLIAASVLTIAASYCAMGSSASVAAICIFSGLGGVANGVEAYALMTALQESTHDRFQARVAALVESATSAAVAIGFLTGGVIATAATPRAAYGVAGGGILIAVAAAALPRLRSAILTPAT